MKTLLLALVLVLTVSPLFGQTEAWSSAITRTYVKCFANRWVGSCSTPVDGTNWTIELTCGKFWAAERNPKLPSPFTVSAPGQGIDQVPYAVWHPALEDILKISKEPK